MHELLNNERQPSLRAKSLDLVGLIREAIRVCQDVERAGVDRRNANVVLDELWSVLSKDKVAINLLGLKVRSFGEIYKKFLDKGFSLSDLVHHLRFYQIQLDEHYKNELEQFIISNYRVSECRPAVKSAISSYLSHLVNLGYSSEFLLTAVEQRFFSDEIKKAETRTLTRFFAQFTSGEKTFVVWSLAKKATANHLKKLGEGWPAIVDPADLPADVDAWRHRISPTDFPNPVVISMRVIALDPISAVAKFNDVMRRAKALTALVKAHVILQWSSRQYVRTPSARTGLTSSLYHSSLREFRLDSTGGGEYRVRGQARRIGNFQIASQERVYSALENGKNSKDQMNGGQSIISTWSAFEILIRNPMPGMVRINHYKDVLIPVLCLRYAKSYTLSAYVDIRLAHKDVVDAHLSDVQGGEDDPVSKFSVLLFTDTQAELQQQFFDSLSGSPLSQYHIWHLRKKFKSPKDHLASLEAHEQRVRWQIERIYRARNQIVHAGLQESYLESVARTANDYFRGSLGPLIFRARHRANVDVDDLLAEFSLDYMAKLMRLKEMRQAKGFSIEDVKTFFE